MKNSIHPYGQRRRSVALAALAAAGVYALIALPAKFPAASPITKLSAHFIAAPAILQGSVMAVLLAGFWFIAHGFKDAISSKEGAYGFFYSLADPRGMRWIGLGFGAAFTLIGIALFLSGNVTIPEIMLSAPAIAAVFALGAPDARKSRYFATDSVLSAAEHAESDATNARIVDADPIR